MQISEDVVRGAIGHFLPYPDGSGYRIKVTVEQTVPEEQPTLSIENVWRIEADQWPQVISGIETMLKAFPSPPSTNKEDGK
jgi:hypothetical protein